MHAFIETPAELPPELGLTQLMLAEHGPMGVVLVIVVALVWKVVIPGLQAAGKMLRDFFDNSLKQGADSLKQGADTLAEVKALRESMTDIKAAVVSGDERVRHELEGVHRSLQAALTATTDHVKKHDTEIEVIRTRQEEYARRLHAVELHAGNSGVFHRPHGTPPSSAA